MIGLASNVVLCGLVDESVWPDDAPDQTVLAAETRRRRDLYLFGKAVVLTGTVWVLAQPLRQRKATLVRVIRRMLETSSIVVDHREAAEAASATGSEGLSDFADRLIGAINASASCTTTLTFDRKAARAWAFTNLSPES